MAVKKCAWATCKSDSRYKNADFMKDVDFFTFPTPNIHNDLDINTIKCREWIKACNRQDEQLNLNIIHEDKIKAKYYYRICSKVTQRVCLGKYRRSYLVIETVIPYLEVSIILLCKTSF